MPETKATRSVCYVLFRVLLPLTLLAAVILRYNALSFLYLVCLLLAPLVRSPSAQSITGLTGHYLKGVIGVSVLTILTMAVFQFTLLGLASDDRPYGSDFFNCSESEKLARQFGVQRFDDVPPVHIARLVVPDVVVLIVSIVVFIVSKKLLQPDPARSQEEVLPVTRPRKRKSDVISVFMGEFILVTLLAASGIIVPSVLNAVYFLVFLALATWWAFYKTLGVKFAHLRIVLTIYTGLHLLVLYLYQFEFFQEGLPHTNYLARLLGLTGILKTDCLEPWEAKFHDDILWPHFVNPGILLLLYWTLSFESRRWKHQKEDVVVDGTVEESAKEKRRRRKRRNKETERQVLEESRVEESLVGAESNPSYNSVTAAETDVKTHDTDDEDGAVGATRKPKGDKRSSFISFLVYSMKQSYVLALIAMMAWSITYHSWLTFVLLLWACVLWMVPHSRRACLYCSPLIVIYAECLLIIQFIYGLDFDGLPKDVEGYSLDEVGLKKFKYPCLQLAVQVIFTLMFWLTLRQFMRERKAWQDENKQPGVPLEPVNSSTSPVPPPRTFREFLNRRLSVAVSYNMDMVDGYDSSTSKIIGHYIWNLLCKYWIFVCGTMMLVIAISDVVLYRLIYMALLLYFVLTFQIWYWWWRKTMYFFWWCVIVYSMIVLATIYTYQFPVFPDLWKNHTGMSDEMLRDIGLEQYDTAGLFVKLLTPTCFLIIIIIQVHYFHTPFLAISDLHRYSKVTDEEGGVDDTALTIIEETTTEDTGLTTATDSETENRKLRRYKKQLRQIFDLIWRKGSNIWASVSERLWRVLEIHIYKVVVFTIFLVCVNEVSAISAVYVVLVAVFLPLPTLHHLMSHITQLYTALVLLSKMAYQLEMVNPSSWYSNCTTSEGNSTSPENITNPVIDPFNKPINNALWVGLEKNTNVGYYIRNYLGILLLFILEAIIRYRQEQRFKNPRIDKPKTGIIFANVRREDADNNLLDFFKFMANYCFYKYGLELCYVMFAIAICVRVDGYAVLYAILLGILLLCNRRGNAYLWWFYTLLIAILLPLQYCSSLGFPMGVCIDYPWDDEGVMDPNLEKWLFLPDYAERPNPWKLIADFFLLLFVCRQARVFFIEISSTRIEEYGGGDNKDILPEVEANMAIPVPDFTGSFKSYLDVAKYFVFLYLFWATLAVVFLTGTSRINLFSMGYVIAVFCFMWYGQEFLLKPLRKLLRMWNILIGYTFFVLFAKACLQLVGCVYITYLFTDYCWVIQLFGITCLRSDSSYRPTSTSSTCKLEEDNTGLTWDVVCFVFLIFQRRIYHCHYFRHAVTEFEAWNRLASRGAYFINRVMTREIQRQKKMELAVLENIKSKMAKIKEKQSKLNKKNYVEPEEHFQTIRSGDYYMFEEEEDDADKVEVPEPSPDSLAIGKEPKDGESSPTPFQLISTALDSGTKKAVDQAKAAEEDGTLSERSSYKSSYSVAPDGTLIDGGSGPTSPQTSTRRRKKPTDSTDGASTSKSPDITSDAKDEDEETAIDAGRTWCQFFLALINSFVDFVIHIFDKISWSYRYVAKKLESEMEEVKEKIKASKVQKITAHEDTPPGLLGDEEEPDRTIGDDLVEVTVDKKTEDPPSKSSSLTDLELAGTEAEDKFDQSKPRVYRLCESTYYMIISRSELVCYFIMILNQLTSASLLSLPYPFMVFLWGMLSVPRPSKTFWITVITYTEAVVVVKYLFQFDFFPWNNAAFTDPFWAPRILGIEKRSNYAACDLALLLALFIHRLILKRYGLWKDSEEKEKVVEQPEFKTETPGADLDAIEYSGGQSLEEGEIEATKPDQNGIDDTEGKTKTKRKFGACLAPFKEFYRGITSSEYNATTDVYAPMFICDFVNFLIIVLGYQSFGPAQSSSGDVSSYLSENRVPVPFLIMLLAQFMLIIIDRGLFLRKNVPGKFIFQLLLVILIHVWLFFILPAITYRSFTQNVAAQLWYFIKCVYFALSAYQIRSGYPTRILGNFLTKKYNYLNLFLFKGFLAIPFLLELRALMDWMWTDTTLTIGSWLQMEDIYANIFVLKCWRHAEAKYPTPRGNRKRPLIKYIVGGLLLAVVILIIWFPLVLFSFANTVYISNLPSECSVSIRLGSYEPIFTATVQQSGIQSLTQAEYDAMKSHYLTDRSALSFLSANEPADITKVTISGQSTAVWSISPPSLSALRAEVNGSAPIKLEFTVSFRREPETGDVSETIGSQYTLRLADSSRQKLQIVLDDVNRTTSESVIIEHLFPRFLRLGSKGQARELPILREDLSNVSVQLKRGNIAGMTEETEWWEVKEIRDEDIFNPSSSKPPVPFDSITMIVFNDRVAPAGFASLVGYGIMGLYVSFILLIGRFLRMGTAGLYQKIMFLQLPFVDRVLRLCINLYLVRELKEFRLEEDMFARLIFLYRSPAMMIQHTRLPQSLVITKKLD